MSRHLIEALAWSLVNSLWQATLIAGLAAAMAVTLRRTRSHFRYALYCVALFLMAAAPVVTLLALLGGPHTALPVVDALRAQPRPITASLVVAGAPAAAASSGQVWYVWLVGSWIAVVALRSLRSLGGWVQLRTLARASAHPTSTTLQETLARLSTRLGIGRVVRVVTTTATAVPGTIGWLVPVMLLPVSVVTRLTPAQIEMILAHEVAHIRRHDYLVNLFQTAIENLLFYHPAVWWASRQIRIEREQCCDDLVVQTFGDPAAYARTLATLETIRAGRPALAVAADGGSLLARIERLVQNRRPRLTPPAWLGALLPLCVVLVALLGVMPPRAAATGTTASPPRPKGFLAGLAEAGYAHISVDEIIALKEHGVEPEFIKAILSTGIGPLEVGDLIRLTEHRVTAGFVEGVVRSGLTKDLGVGDLVSLRENGVEPEAMTAIRRLGFGPFTAEEMIRLRQHGVSAETFEALKEAGASATAVADAIRFQEHGITIEAVRSAKRQGFTDLTADRIIKLRLAGTI